MSTRQRESVAFPLHKRVLMQAAFKHPTGGYPGREASQAPSHPSPLAGEGVVNGPEEASRRRLAADVMPLLRGLASQYHRLVGNFTDDAQMLGLVYSQDLVRQVQLNVLWADQSSHTEFRPLVLDAAAMHTNASGLKKYLIQRFEDYRQDYAASRAQSKDTSNLALRDPHPFVVLWPGVGMFTFAKDKQIARVAAEYYTNALIVSKSNQLGNVWQGLSEYEECHFEYWLLELQHMSQPRPHSIHAR